MPANNTKTCPQVFIIESLRIHEEERPTEGRLLRSFLQMSGKDPELAVVRSRKEFAAAMEDFEDSGYRYLHLSCHGNKKEVCTSTDHIAFDKFARMAHSCLKRKRLFLSACQAVNDDLANELFRESELRSLAGSPRKVDFHHAAIFWTSFYYAMFDRDREKMSDKAVAETLKQLSGLYCFPVRLYLRDEAVERGYSVALMNAKA